MANKYTPIKQARKHCLDCSGGSYSEVRDCLIAECHMYLFRMGKRPTKQDQARHEQALKESREKGR